MTVWVLGSGGLLGSAVVECVEQTETVWTPPQPINWSDANSYRIAIDLAVRTLASEVCPVGKPWTIYWCAGVGSLGASEETNNMELDQVSFFLETVMSYMGERCDLGTVFYASSAGGVYGGSTAQEISEETPVEPNSPYGIMKLKVEEKLRSWAISSGAHVAVGRIANLYGLNQNIHKQQGLISTACRALLQQKPIEIYVPLDTVRNYIFVDDAAFIAVSLTRKISMSPPSSVETKLICSPHNLSIADLLLMLRQVFGKRPPLALSNRTHSSFYNRRMVLISRRHRELEPAQFALPLHGVAVIRRKTLVDTIVG